VGQQDHKDQVEYKEQQAHKVLELEQQAHKGQLDQKELHSSVKQDQQVQQDQLVH
jgi:hypothetical protein